MASIKVNTKIKRGAFKPVNGIDNGPVCFGSLIDSSEYYIRAAFPYCRLHDTNYPHPREVDIPAIFRNFDADPDDPANYFFKSTDIYLNDILATGAKIIYRLGVSIEHPRLKYYVDPPKDFEKWARICLNIARHYNEGWADGFHMNIEYWEVWNEPDQLTPDRSKDVMWSGTPGQYYELYAATASEFKKYMPGVKIGGFAGCGMLSPERFDYFINFLKFIRERGLPLDFYSWHCYTSKLNDLRENARIARENLDKFGFVKTLSILDEWNYLVNIPDLWGRIFGGVGSRIRKEVFTETSGIIGASFTAAALIEMIDLPIDIATFYEGQPVNIFATIFDRYGVPTKQYYAFDAFNRLKRYGERTALECDIPGVYALASASDKSVCIMAVNWDGVSDNYECEIGGLDQSAEYNYELYLLDEYRDLEPTLTLKGKPAELPRRVYLHKNSVALLRIFK